MKVAYDMSSVCWTSLLVGKDTEAFTVKHEDKEVSINTAAYGYENAVNLMLSALQDFRAVPSDMILVFEGMHSKRRRTMICPTYKASRGSRPPEAYAEFAKLQEMLSSAFLARGAIAVTQDCVEADDVLAWLAKNSKEDLAIVTNDNDLAALNGANVSGAETFVRVNGNIRKNSYGEFDFRLITLYKTLVGDSSDNIKGVRGFGPKAFEKLLAAYGEDGGFELLGIISSNNVDGLAELAVENKCKTLGLIVDNWQDVQTCFSLASLHPEWVNTRLQALRWSAGKVSEQGSDERLRKWKLQTRLIGATNYDSALEFLKSKLSTTKFVGFDIETSVPDESLDWAQAAGVSVDVIGSYLVGFSLSFGDNNQYAYYVSVKHAGDDNITMVQARQMLECLNVPVVVHNMNFELPVLHMAKDEDGSRWGDLWAQNGCHGFLPNCLDTKLEASYVNENLKSGLKLRSLHHLGYKQDSYDDTTILKGKPYAGGTEVVKSGEIFTAYRMHELPAQHVFAYGADDAIVTAALHNFFKLHMELESHYDVYLAVEVSAAYLHAQSFVQGVKIDVGRCRALEKGDDKTFADAWAILRSYLLANGWKGTVPPKYVGEELDAKAIKLAYAIVTGQAGEEDEERGAEGEEAVATPDTKDAVLSSRVRTPAKLVALIAAEGEEVLAAHITEALAGKAENLEAYVLRHFSGEPVFKSSNKQLAELLYGVMKLPVRVRNKLTETARKEGSTQGSPKADALALEYAMRDADAQTREYLEAIKLMQMVKTRKGLYYSKYPYFVHWLTGRLHGAHNQCSTNTRRASASAPNLQQLPKHPKIEGQPAKFREVVIPHKPCAVIVSMDFVSQELVVIADYSKDTNMLACFVGDSLKDMHTLTAVGIAKKHDREEDWDYDKLSAALADPAHPKHKAAKQYRTLGKKTNFTSEYGAAAPKLAQTLLCSENDAQTYLDAREAAFPQASKWKSSVIAEAVRYGTVRTKLGAVRHLAEALNSDDRYISSKAERQAVNFKVQSSSAEMTKLAEGRMWKAGLCQKFDCEIVGPIHDEVVASCAIADLPGFITEMHAAMVQPYADMEIPVRSSVSIGKNFSQQIEVGEGYVESLVTKALEDLK